MQKLPGFFIFYLHLKEAQSTVQFSRKSAFSHQKFMLAAPRSITKTVCDANQTSLSPQLILKHQPRSA
jgi:hypothetical protein